MSQIDISQWKEFKVGDILNINSSKYIYHARNLYIEDNKLNNKYYPYVVRTEFNNGIRGYIEEDQSTLNSGHTISLAQDTAQFFYQEEPYFTGNKIKICALNDDTVELTKNKALFLISALYKAFATFSYDSSFNVTRLNKVIIKLPVDSNGDPDWQYMDTYIAKLTALAHKNVSSLKQTKAKPAKLNIDHWGEFKLSELFEPKFTDGDNKPQQLIKNDNALRLIGATADNQGCVGRYESNTHVFPKNTITWDRFGHAFVQLESYRTMAHGNVMVLVPKKVLTLESVLYIASIINKLNDKYQLGYSNTLTQRLFNRITIKLPIDANGEPDWEYMDNQVRHLATLSNLMIASLCSVI